MRSNLHAVDPALATAAFAMDEPRLFSIAVALAGGEMHKIEAAAGFSAMELIRAAGVPIAAECGGAGVCATCHCRVPDAWAAHLPQPTDEEQEKLDAIPLADDRSRLSCQIQITDALAGLVLELQPDSVKLGAWQPPYLDAAE